MFWMLPSAARSALMPREGEPVEEDAVPDGGLRDELEGVIAGGRALLGVLLDVAGRSAADVPLDGGGQRRDRY